MTVVEEHGAVDFLHAAVRCRNWSEVGVGFAPFQNTSRAIIGNDAWRTRSPLILGNARKPGTAAHL